MSSFKLNKKKSRLQMHRAEEERKRLEAAAEVEAVYADFVDSFDVDDPGDKAFVRAGTMEGGKFSQSGEPESKKRYVPGGGSSSSTKKKKGGGFGGIDLSAMGGVAKKTKKGKEPSQRELFLQEMKREQQDRDARLAGRKAGGGKFAMGDRPPGGGSLFDVAPPLGYNAGSGSHTDTGDNTTTNLYVGNIPPTVTEDILWRQFSVYGAIASVKIMWPRTDEERARNRNCGFVQYMERQAAERGKNAMDGTKLEEFEMKIGWGKKVAKPLTPMYPPGMGPGGQLSGAQPGLGQTFLGMNVPQGPGGQSYGAPDNSGRVIVVEPPSSGEVMAVADTLAGFVACDGMGIEGLIKEKEHGNPLFQFLFDTRSRDHTYYRWRCFSLAMGDTIEKWRAEPFQMYVLGSTWQPPACPIVMPDLDVPGNRSFAEGGRESAKKSESERGSHDKYEAERLQRRLERERDADGRGRVLDGQLSGNQRDQLEDMLRGLSSETLSVQDGMMWCLDHSEAANEIVEVIFEALMIPAAESSIEKKLARIYLVSDILHNSSASVPKASRFRSGFESRLPEIFANLREAMLAIPGRITMLEMQDKISKVLDVWETWSIYTPSTLIQFRSAFTGKAIADVLDGEPLDESELSAPTAAPPPDDLDGEAIDDLDGEALSDVDGEDLDGEPIETGLGLCGYGDDD